MNSRNIMEYTKPLKPLKPINDHSGREKRLEFSRHLEKKTVFQHKEGLMMTKQKIRLSGHLSRIQTGQIDNAVMDIPLNRLARRAIKANQRKKNPHDLNLWDQ